MKVLLIGNPNVGKSALFSHMTGISVKTSNYAGTTVTYTEGRWQLPTLACNAQCSECAQSSASKKTSPNRKPSITTTIDDARTSVDLIDVPGTYSLDPEAKSEKIAVDMIQQGDVIINVVDATNLERNLSLTLDLFQYQKPMIVVLNMWDETAHMGIHIDMNALEKQLGVPVVPTNGRSGMGVLQLGHRFHEACTPSQSYQDQDKWHTIGDIVEQVQTLTHRHHTLRDRLQEISIHPVWGLPVALLVLAVLFFMVIYLGGVLNGWVNQLFTAVWIPWMDKLYHAISIDWLRTILIGNLIEGQIALETSMGVLTTGIFVPLGLVTPYLLMFYIVLGFLEDWGYLPRMAVIFDGFFHKMGLHGYSIIPLMLSTGCNIPGVLSLRNLETRRERFITAAIACTTIPCLAQSAVIFAAVSSFGSVYLALVIMTLVTTAIIMGVVMNRFVRGATPTLVVEMPPYRIPGLKMQAKKLLSRLRGFFTEAVPLMMLGIFIVQVLYLTGAIESLFNIMKPIVVTLWGLPEETAVAMLVGIIRKDAAIALLAPLSLNPMQVVTAVVTLVLYFPCVATYTVLAREMGKKDLLWITLIMMGVALIGGIVMHLIGIVLSPMYIILLEILLCIGAFLLSKRRH